MSDPTIRLLSTDDLDAALGLSVATGWNQRLDDWRVLLRMAPEGSFAALIDGRLIGTAIGIDYGGFAWIAMMLVDPAYRGRGVGRALLEAAMDAVPSQLPIRLDATPLGRPLYQRHGFEDEAKLTRHVRPDLQPDLLPDPLPAAASREKSSGVRRLAADDLKIVIDQDNEVFGGRRETVLEWALRSAPQDCHVVHGDAGPAHYCFGREGRLFDQIGPVVAADADIATALVCAALAAAAGRPVIVDAFDSHDTFVASLHDLGFQAQRPLFRMCRPPGLAAPPTAIRKRPVLAEFAILGPEFA